MPNIHLHYIDCMRFMATKPDGHYDLAVCDIPYGIGVAKMAFTQESSRGVKQKNGTTLKSKSRQKYEKSNWDNSVPSQEYFNELRRVSKHQIIFGVEYVENIWTGLGVGRIKWNKGMPEGVSFKGYEMAYCSMINNTREIDLLWAGMMQAKSLDEPTVQQGNKRLNEKRRHVCHKPSLLYARLLKDYAEPGFKILDTHVGAGEIMRVCHNFNMDIDACEVDLKIFTETSKWWNEYISQNTLFR